MKLVVKLQWDSEDGVLVYREVYEDGTKGLLVKTGIETNGPQLMRKKREIEAELIGQRR